MRKKWLVGVLAVFAACTSLQYQDDVGFLVSAQADSPEFPVYVNGHLCTDMEGSQGLCSKRLKSTDDLTIAFDAQTYAYLLTMRCSSGIDPVAPVTVPAGQKYQLKIPASAFSTMREFICQGLVAPQDRVEPTSAMFSIHVIVYDARYTQRERAYLTKQGDHDILVLGENARSAWVYDDGKWSQHWHEPVVELQGDPAKVKAYSESFTMRFNALNLSDADTGVISE